MSVELDSRVHLDPRRLRQVLLNLLRNAADATEEGDTIHVMVSQLDDEALITVRDEGTGMASPPPFERKSLMSSSPPRGPPAWVWGWRSAATLWKSTVDD